LEEKSDLLEIWRFIVEDDDAQTRLDQFLAEQEVGLTRSRLKKLIEEGFVTVDSEEARPSKKLKTGMEIALKVPPPTLLSASPEEIPLDIHYEDDHLIVINKPQGLVVHPAPGHPSGTLVNGILFRFAATGGDPMRPGIVHRLDKDTSGLIAIAKTEEAHAKLARQFHDHSVERRYRALVAGSPPDRGEWRTLYGRRPRDRKGKQAISRFETLERFKGAALLEVTLLTGRTHQVRVHCSDHGFPVLGDRQYGPRNPAPELKKVQQFLRGQALHAGVLGFDHPASKERIRFEAAPPDAFVQAYAILKETS
jgi:23S rRNA pseudouridine1911/1915/1917 synthase